MKRRDRKRMKRLTNNDSSLPDIPRRKKREKRTATRGGRRPGALKTHTGKKPAAAPAGRIRRRAGTVMLHVSPEGKILSALRQFSLMLGHPAHSHVGKDLMDVVHPASRHHVRLLLRGAMNAPEESTVRLLTSTGSAQLFHLTARRETRRKAGDIVVAFSELLPPATRQEGPREEEDRDWKTARQERDAEELRLLFANHYENAPLGYLALEAHGMILAANPTASTILGLERTEQLPLPLWPLIAPGDRRKLLAHLSALRTGEIKVVTDLSLQPRGHAPIPVRLLSGQMHLRPAGNDRFLTVLFDQSEQKHVELQLQAREERLRAVLDAAELGEWDLETVTQEVHCSPRAAELFGYAAVGTKWNLSTFLGHVATEDRSRVTENIQQAITTRQQFEFRCGIERVDGARRWIWMTGRIEPDVAGGATRLHGLVQDVTERRQLEEDLRESRERAVARAAELERVLDAVPAAVWIAQDARGDYITGNRLSYGWLRIPPGTNASTSAPEGVRPESFKLFKDGVEIPVAKLPMHMSAAGKDLRNYEFDLVYPDGSSRHLMGNSTPLWGSTGDPRGSVSVYIDVTARKREEEEFAQAVQLQVFEKLIAALREFRHGEGSALNLHRLALFARNSHVILSEQDDHPAFPPPAEGSALTRLEHAIHQYATASLPRLRAIASLLRAVQLEINRDASPGEEPVYAADMYRSAELLRGDLAEFLVDIRSTENTLRAKVTALGVRIVDHVQNIFRIVDSLFHTLNTHFTANVLEVVRGVVADIQSSAPTVVVDVSPEASQLKAIIGPADLAAVLSVLLRNSVEARLRTGATTKHLALRTGVHGARVRIEVEDNGEGVPGEIQGRLFNEHVTTKGTGRGSGLGYAQKHLWKYGGTLAYDTLFQEGARFVIELDLAQPTVPFS